VPLYALGASQPSIDPTAWLHPDAVLIGNVTIGADVSVWPCAVLRGDFGRIEIGARTSVQDGAVLHCAAEHPTIIGADCIVGHNVYLEGCTIEDGVLVGSMSAVLPGVVVGRGAVIAAGAVVTGGAVVPARARARGVPAQIETEAVEEGRWAFGPERYVEMARRYAREMRVVEREVPGE
jgi:carbonic anhydrase/acetyltransferase-like protein (isoleucine patch superfamily)